MKKTRYWDKIKSFLPESMYIHQVGIEDKEIEDSNRNHEVRRFLAMEYKKKSVESEYKDFVSSRRFDPLHWN